MADPTPIRHRLQIARAWAALTALDGGLTLADPDLVAAGLPAPPSADLFAVAMPTVDRRAGLAASLTDDGAREVTRGAQLVSVRAEAHGPSLAATGAVLEDLRRIVAGDLWVALHAPFNDGVTDTRGFLGAGPSVRATAEGDGLTLARIYDLSVQVGPQDVSLDLADAASAAGQAVGRMVLGAMVQFVSVPAPVTAFRVDAAAPAEAASVTVTETLVRLLIATGPGLPAVTEIALADHATAGDLAAAIDALGDWQISGVDPGLAGRDPRSAIPTGQYDVAGGADAPIRLWQ